MTRFLAAIVLLLGAHGAFAQGVGAPPISQQSGPPSATNFTGTLPVANGGTGDTGTAYTPYTPSLACGTGTLTTASATGRSKSLGKTVFVTITATITTLGTCATNVTASLPSTANSAAQLAGRENGVSGKMLQGFVAPTSNVATILNYDNTFAAASGASLVVSGHYESQ